MKNKRKAKRKIGKANPIIYAIVYLILKRKYTKKYNISYDKAKVKEIKGPAIVLATHTCDEDHVLSALTLYPIRPTYVVSEHFLHNKKTARLLKLMHVIPKKMFNADVTTIINIMRAKSENAVIVIFPEGRLSCYGHSMPLTEGTAQLIKKLGVDVYHWQADGAYLTFPKWRDKGDARIGKINCSVKSLISAEELSQMSVDEVTERVEAAILHDDELAMAGVEYKSRDIARGVDKILYKCPLCNSEGALTAACGHITCTCGLDATLDGFYRLHNAPFERIDEWFEWQIKMLDADNDRLYSRARLGACGIDGFMDPSAGTCEIFLDKNEFKLVGTLRGERIELTTAPEKIGAFPITPGDHFDVYHKGQLLYVYPEPDMRLTVKWVIFLDKLVAKAKAAASV